VVASGEDISRGTCRTSTPGISAGSAGATSQASSSRQAAVGHPAHDGAADDRGDADDAGGGARQRLPQARHTEDRADGDDGVGRRQQDGVGGGEGLDDPRSRPGGLDADLHERGRVQGGVVPDPPLLEVDGPPAAGVGIGHDHVGLDPLVAHRQEGDAGLPALRERRRDGRQRIAGVQHPGADEVGGQVPVAQPEPIGVGAVGRQLLLDRPALAGPAPAPLLVDAAAEGVHDRVEVRTDPQPVHRHVVAGVDHRCDLRLRGCGTHSTQESSPSSPSGEHDDLHEMHPAAWAVVDCLTGVSWVPTASDERVLQEWLVWRVAYTERS